MKKNNFSINFKLPKRNLIFIPLVSSGKRSTYLQFSGIKATEVKIYHTALFEKSNALEN